MTPTVNMTLCLEKAINVQETSIKEKHIRNIIIGTFQEKGLTKFWNFVQQLPLRKNVILCWKVCHVLHKVLKEGHEHVLRDSQQFKHILYEKCKIFWTQFHSGYGNLVKLYWNLLMIKLNFHLINNRIPGNFDIGEDYLRLCEKENSQLLTQMFDLLEAILILENEVLKTIDSSSSTTMTHPNQCKFQPLVICVQESTIIYSHITKILFGMHKRISSPLLIGHRERYMKVFLTMKNINFKIQFFMQSLDIDILNSLKNFSVDNFCHSTPLIQNPADQKRQRKIQISK